MLVFTAYLSLSGVISGSADSAGCQGGKADHFHSSTSGGKHDRRCLRDAAGQCRAAKKRSGNLWPAGVLAVSVVPFLQTGCQYLLLKGTAAAAGVVGEKELSGLIGAMAGAMGLLTAVTGACTLILMIGCVCFMKVSI